MSDAGKSIIGRKSTKDCLEYFPLTKACITPNHIGILNLPRLLHLVELNEVIMILKGNLCAPKENSKDH